MQECGVRVRAAASEQEVGSTYLDRQLRIPLLRVGEGRPYRDSFSVKF